ncbi:unnamed protein product, partial [Brenthis ino]
MNVVQRESRKTILKPKSKLVRKDAAIGILGSIVLPRKPQTTANTFGKINRGLAPRYEFNIESRMSTTSKRSSMGPPSGPPPSVKRRIINYSSSSKPETSSSGQPRILANDSANYTSEFCTPKNKPSTLRYISSSSRGGHSGTRSARSTSTSVVDASVILAISEGRGMARGEIGMAAVDLRRPHLVLCQFSDTLLYTHTLTKINYFNPIEIIVPHTFCEGVQPNQLYQLIKDQYPLVNVTAVQRRYFNDAAGRQNIQTLCAPQYSAVYLQVLHKFYALTAAAAVLKYVEYIQCIVFARESLKIEYRSSENTMIIDVGTATQLELVQPLQPSAGPTCCLLGVLGPTYTFGGIRALRAAILQPSCNKEHIEGRLDAVQELIENETGLMADLQDVLKKLSDIDKILFLCIETPNQNMDKYGESQLNQTILLKTTMEMVPNLIEALNTVESPRLRAIKMDFENPHYNEISSRIRDVIQDDAHLEKGAMGSLQRCFAVKPEINGLLDVARRTYSELIDDIQKIVQQLSEMHDLPIRLNQNVMKGFHIVLPVAPKNRRHFNIEDLPPVFIQASTVGSYIRPEFDCYVEIRNSVHPLLDYNSHVMPVPNDILGCFLPATNAVLRLCDRIFSRIGFNDNVEFNASSYVIEMKETQHILKGLTSSSLVIIDELCSCHTAAKEEINSQTSERRLIYQHKIEPGVTKIEHYGLALAATTNLPRDTVNLAKELAELIARNIKPQTHKSPSISFEKILYELNAKIRQESRKNSKFEETIPKMIQQFKIDNPLIIDKLKVERNKSDTNSNINSTMSSEAITNRLRTNTEKYIENNENHNKNIYNAVENSNSTTGYSNSTQEHFTTSRALYASIKSSTHLLNTMENSKFDRINNENLDEKLKPLQKIQTSLMMNDNDHTLKTAVNNNDSNNRNNDPVYNDQDEIIESYEINEEINESDESDIASALTQILEETSDASMDSDNKMSVDEELMRETVQEISEEQLNKLNVDLKNIILTPPLEFRD